MSGARRKIIRQRAKRRKAEKRSIEFKLRHNIFETCPDCYGKGEVEETRKHNIQFTDDPTHVIMTTALVKCATCKGKGAIPRVELNESALDEAEELVEDL